MEQDPEANQGLPRDHTQQLYQTSPTCSYTHLGLYVEHTYGEPRYCTQVVE